MKRLVALFFFLLSSEARAACSFSTGDYIDEMSNPSQIMRMNVEVPKSSKYARNIYKIVSSRTENIPPKLKKKFKAIVSVHYSFGVCDYAAVIRQNGDWKDHIGVSDGQFIRSLDVKLKDGNIVNAVRFKLLIPETRFGQNEVLASLILRKLGFISPETFEVQTTVNGINAVMLFQERSEKELLERNLRREGPIFEGDESLIWSYEGFENFELEPLALARLTNDNWFKKGASSRAIVLQAAAELQQAYLKYAHTRHTKGDKYAIFPNTEKDDLFINYHAALLAMRATHALRPHNRKYYYNALDSSFEPIYYDGNVEFGSTSRFEEIESLLPYGPTPGFVNKALSLGQDDDLAQAFLQRMLKKEQKERFFNTSLQQFKDNLRAIETYGKSRSKQAPPQAQAPALDEAWYEDFQKNKKVTQKRISKITLGDVTHVVEVNGASRHNVSSKVVAKILAKNQWQKERAVYVPTPQTARVDGDVRHVTIGASVVKMSKGLAIEIDRAAKQLTFTQSNPFQWALISGGDFSGWNVVFDGLSAVIEEADKPEQRFNSYGLTGCLTLYQSLLHKASFSVSGGACEDSLNIVSSTGEGVSLVVKDAYADAVDSDFSVLSIPRLEIKNAGNDCFDVSGGDYFVDVAVLETCQDKAISVGEKSKFLAKQVFVRQANIGVSAKDMSKVKISKLEVADVVICAEAKRKKQEFGGAEMRVDAFTCSSPVDVDAESKFSGGAL